MTRNYKRLNSAEFKDISNTSINDSFDVTFGEKCFYRVPGEIQARVDENKENINCFNTKIRESSVKQFHNEPYIKKVHLIPLRVSNSISTTRRDSLNISVSPNNSNSNNNSSRSPTEINNRIPLSNKSGNSGRDKPPANPYISISTSSVSIQKNELKIRNSLNGVKKENMRIIKHNNFITNPLNFNETVNLSLDQQNSNKSESLKKKRLKETISNNNTNIFSEDIYSTMDNRRTYDSYISSPERKVRKGTCVFGIDYTKNDEKITKEEVASPIWLEQEIKNEFLINKNNEEQKILLKSFSFRKEMNICVEEIDKQIGIKSFEKIDELDNIENTSKAQQGSCKARKMKLPANQFWQNFFQNVKKKTMLRRNDVQADTPIAVGDRNFLKKPVARSRNNSMIGNRDISYFQERRGQVYEQESLIENKRNCISHIDCELSQNEESINEILNISDICGSNRNQLEKPNIINQEKRIVSLHQRKFSLNLTKAGMQKRKSSTQEINVKKLREKNYELGFNKIRRVFTRKTSYFFFVNLLKTYYSKGKKIGF